MSDLLLREIAPWPCAKPIDPPSPKRRSVSNTLHELALLSPDQFAAVEGFVDQALRESSDAPPVERWTSGSATGRSVS
jgi:hypothetical protein